MFEGVQSLVDCRLRLHLRKSSINHQVQLSPYESELAHYLAKSHLLLIDSHCVTADYICTCVPWLSQVR